MKRFKRNKAPKKYRFTSQERKKILDELLRRLDRRKWFDTLAYITLGWFIIEGIKYLIITYK